MTQTAGLDLLIDYDDLARQPWQAGDATADLPEEHQLDTALFFLLEIPAWIDDPEGHRRPLWFRADAEIAVQTAHGTFIGRPTEVAWIGEAGSRNGYRIDGQVIRYHPPAESIHPGSFQDIVVYVDLGDGYLPENMIPVCRCELREIATDHLL